MREQLSRIRRFLRHRPQFITNLQTIGAAVTFALALAWLALDAGWLEPVTLMVAALFSIGFLWASRIAPPVSQLSDAALRTLISTSDPKQDWERIPTAHPRPAIWAYRWDRSLIITDPGDTDRDEFTEPWIPKLWNGNHTFHVSVRRADQLEFELHLISIDGGRSVLHYPRSADDLRISKLQDTIARIVKEIDDAHYPYDRYLQQAKITVTDDHGLRLEPLR